MTLVWLHRSHRAQRTALHRPISSTARFLHPIASMPRQYDEDGDSNEDWDEGSINVENEDEGLEDDDMSIDSDRPETTKLM